MSKATIIDNNLLKNEIKALYDYVNRGECNLVVVECMLDELHHIIMEIKPCEKESITSGYVHIDSDVELPRYKTSIDTTSYETSTSITHLNNAINSITCPYCGSIDNQFMYRGITLDGKTKSTHYVCDRCHKEFDVDE